MSLLDALTKSRFLARLVSAAAILTALVAVLYAGLSGLILSPELYAFIGGIIGSAATFLWSEK